jgi:spore coat assembly protein
MKQGDLVVRKSYGGDVIFRIENVIEQYAILKGYEFRLLADSPLIDLQMVEDVQTHTGYRLAQNKIKETSQWMLDSREVQKEQQNLSLSPKDGIEHPYFEMPGKVLHLDGDPLYLRKSMMLYEKLRVPVEGFHSVESEMPEVLYKLIAQVKPDIVVITGHDGLLKNRMEGGLHSLSSYKNSLNFTNAVKIARQYERNRDALIIIAGACQSHFEALLQAGANFASSPARILIHALDPVYIASKASYTSIKETINMFDVIRHTMSGLQGLGGIESKGSYRIGVPRI